MNLLHSLTSLLHGLQCFLVDVRRLDRIDLLFKRGNLGRGLIERVFMLFLSFECRSGRYIPSSSSA